MIGFKEINGNNYCRYCAVRKIDVDDVYETTIKIEEDLKPIYITETERLRISQLSDKIKFVTVFDKMMEVIFQIMAEEFWQARHGRLRYFN